MVPWGKKRASVNKVVANLALIVSWANLWASGLLLEEFKFLLKYVCKN